MKHFQVFYNIPGSMVVEAETEEEAVSKVMNMDTEELCAEAWGESITKERVFECDKDGVEI